MNGTDNLLEYEYGVGTSAIQTLASEEMRTLTFKFLRIEVLRDQVIAKASGSSIVQKNAQASSLDIHIFPSEKDSSGSTAAAAKFRSFVLP